MRFSSSLKSATLARLIAVLRRQTALRAEVAREVAAREGGR
ncbi:hypothetical protein [Ancylobacter oerskovii]|uniref:Uncharacterized protein n=1 Tax=Ancylobacter oerskovii TaxID=459519 RepID=A0ABW4YXT2_9HYPH|nr:hypothetical protein [Ancylobacter oerskovii]